MQSDNVQPEGASVDIVMESLLDSVMNGEHSKHTIYIQVKFTA